MKYPTAYLFLSLIALFSCKTAQKPNFIKSRKEKLIVLTGAPAPHVLFVLENRDTLKFSSRDIYSELEKAIKKQIEHQGYLTSQTWEDLAGVMKNQSRDTLVFRDLSAVNDKTLSGILETSIARALILKGQVIVALKDQTVEPPKQLRYIFLRDNSGGQQGNFYTNDNTLIYRTIITLGE
ncbi:hypothetical protein KJS94_02805 [Flavihumibacter rivuli]|uniref:hypothetical protein n=1 Tax=Flavihumibacter rivuli TaxID=2838156 RepID=UPI001BDE3F88|nr:hypothetical protein [Flavihumibacter rivuli]ULQ57126.1 hypothetical protein KJS94_02805 [Flavihumibacter rivuli]